MGTSPFANTSESEQKPLPAFLQQDPKNGTWAGGLSNVVKALVAGNNRFMSGQKPNVANGPVGDTRTAGEPLSLAPDNINKVSAPAIGNGAPMAPNSAPTLWDANRGGPPPAGAGPVPFEQGAAPIPYAPAMPANGMIASNGDSTRVPGLPNGTDPTINALFGGAGRG